MKGWNSSQSTRKSMLFHLIFMIYLLSNPASSHKRLMHQKKQRDRERKELDALGRRQLANVRVVQRNVVYVVGIGPRFAKEEVRQLLFSCLSCHHTSVVNPDSTVGGLFWQVWENLKDSSRQEDAIRRS